MARGKILILLSVAILFGFGAGFALRPVIMSPTHMIVASSPSPVGASTAPRGTQYFEANIEEARRLVAACRDGMSLGEECTNAQTAIITVESKERFKRFVTER